MISRPIFKDRRHAGRELGDRLKRLTDGNLVVIGLPRGGVEVGFEVARILRAPLDVIVARKLGAPNQPELGIGAIAPGGIMLLDERTVRQLGLSREDIEQVAEQERAEMDRRLNEYRGDDSPLDFSGKTVVIVDDGLATGVTALASIRAARAANAKRIVLAVPVCARETAAQMEEEVDILVCLEQPDPFIAVGVWYDHFGQTSDAQVIELLEEAGDFVSSEELTEI